MGNPGLILFLPRLMISMGTWFNICANGSPLHQSSKKVMLRKWIRMQFRRQKTTCLIQANMRSKTPIPNRVIPQARHRSRQQGWKLATTEGVRQIADGKSRTRQANMKRPFAQTGMLLGLLVIFCAIHANAADDYDVVIQRGTVVDPETGLQDVRDVGIQGGTIAAVSRDTLTGSKIIEAKGLIVAPGFIDLHAHGQDLDNSRFQVMDGVTTACEMEIGVPDVDAYYRQRTGDSLNNFGATIGLTRIRIDMTGDPGRLVPKQHAAKNAFDAKQLEEVYRRVDAGLQQGALGVGIGLQYIPGATREEIQEVFRIAARHGAAIYVHIRHAGVDATTGGVNAAEEVIATAAITGASLHIVHINSSGGPNAPLMLRMVTAAADRGIDVTTECYPYGAGLTEISSAIFDGDWKRSFGIDYGDLQWVATGERLTADTFEVRRKETGAVILHMNPPGLVEQLVLHPATIIASDGEFRERKGHPRTAGTFSRVLGKYVRDSGQLPLMRAIVKMSLMPAMRLQTRAPDAARKGRIQVGADADIVVFDLDTIQDNATYADPAQFSEGMRYVFVNGVAVVENGELQDDRRPGTGLRAPTGSPSK
jgi:predicted amidohydrolase